jgi:cytochrome b561
MKEQLRYGAVAKVCHWTIVVLLAVQLPLGWLMPNIRQGMTPGTAMVAHITIGITILVLIILRFIWRVTHPVAPESNLPAWQRVSSELVHWLLYVVVLATTLTGWSFESDRGWNIPLYGVFRLPNPTAQGSTMAHALGQLHSTLVWVLVVLVSVHILSALAHLFVYRDRVMHRMLWG